MPKSISQQESSVIRKRLAKSCLTDIFGEGRDNTMIELITTTTEGIKIITKGAGEISATIFLTKETNSSIRSL